MQLAQIFDNGSEKKFLRRTAAGSVLVELAEVSQAAGVAGRFLGSISQITKDLVVRYLSHRGWTGITHRVVGHRDRHLPETVTGLLRRPVDVRADYAKLSRTAGIGLFIRLTSALVLTGTLVLGG